MPTKRTLLIDADERFWETISTSSGSWPSLSQHLATRSQRGHVEQLLWQHEQHNIQAIGYGTKVWSVAPRNRPELTRLISSRGSRERRLDLTFITIDLMQACASASLAAPENQLIVLTKGRDE